MPQISTQNLRSFHYCVVIPTYNNAKTLQWVIDGVLKHTSDIIVVNDGSTDATSQILLQYPQLPQIHLPKNKGKGNALRLAFAQAEKSGFQYAISLDSDGQHFPDDIPVFLKALEESANKNLLLIGGRNMTQKDVPKKSSFGNTFSNFWFWVETGIRLQDTQSGFRLYPLFAMKKLQFYTHKFEFEIEAIVKSAWSGIEVKNVPINVHYEKTDRISHFRPFRDFTRISILNTWFVFLAFFYVKPRNLIRKLKKKGVKRFLMEDLLHSDDSSEKKAFSIALGVLIGLSPLWGFHTLLVIFFAILFNLNKVIAFAFSNISLPPFIPFIFYFSLQYGSWILGRSFSFSMSEIEPSTAAMNYLEAYILGSLALAVTASILAGLMGYIFFLIFERKKIVTHG